MKTNIIVIVIAVILAGGFLTFMATRGGQQGVRGVSTTENKQSSSQTKSISTESNVSVVDGKQIVEIQVKGGYRPRKSVAKAGLPTILRFVTNGTFDCSSSIVIPSLKLSKNLPNTGNTDIEIGTPDASILQGTCSMGMYNFEVDFEV